MTPYETCDFTPERHTEPPVAVSADRPIGFFSPLLTDDSCAGCIFKKQAIALEIKF